MLFTFMASLDLNVWLGFLPTFPPKVFFFFNCFFFCFGCSSCADVSVVVASRGYSLVAVHELLIVVVSLVADHGL